MGFSDEYVIELPRRHAMTLVDTSPFMGGGLLGGQAVPTDTTAGGGTTSTPTDLLSSAMSRVSGASALAQQTGPGAQATNVDSPDSSAFATTP